MSTTRPIMMWISILILVARVAAASPQVNFPLSSQYPPIARAGSPYNFQFAITTFQPDPDRLQYSLIGNPSWLSLNGKTRTLSGTPKPGDTGTATFTIAAAGEAGLVANMESKLFVTNDKSPTINGDISEILSSAGQLSAPKTLALLPLSQFDIKFPQHTFTNSGKSLVYLATLADHTPLPAWISFDATTLRFAGTTPPMSTIPQTFDISLIASDNSGFAAASITFSIVVSTHQFLFKPLQEGISLTKGDPVNISGLRKMLFLDNESAGDQDIQSASAEIPSWLSFNDHTLDLTGTPPSGLMSQDITITMKDKFGDTAKHSIHLIFKSQLFNNEVGTLNITTGQDFQYTVPKTVLLHDDEVVVVDFGPLAGWLKFDPATLTITGTIPDDTDSQTVEAVMTATSGDGKLKDTQAFGIEVSNPDGLHKAHTQDPNDPDNVFGSKHPENQSKSRAGVIAGAVVGALAGSVIVVLFACIWCRRKKISKGYMSPRSPRKSAISRPKLQNPDWETVHENYVPDLERALGKNRDSWFERTPERPPQPNLDIKLKSKVSASPDCSIDERESHNLNSSDDFRVGYKDEAGPSHRPYDSMRISTAIARREFDHSDPPNRHSHRTTAVYRDSHRSTGLPINRRLTGLGHGRRTCSPSSSSNNMSPYNRRTLSCNSNSTQSTRFSLNLPTFAQPSTARHSTQLTTPADKRCSIRLVPRTSTRESLQPLTERRRSRRKSLIDSLSDLRTIDEKRQSYIRKRASTQSPFFGASSSRVSSSSYKLPSNFPEIETPTKAALSSLFQSTPVKSDEVVMSSIEREPSESLRIRKPSDTPTVELEAPTEFPGSLRKPPTARSFTNRHTTSNTEVIDRDRVYKRYDRPGTAHAASYLDREASTRLSLRAQELKSSLNSLTGSNVFEDVSESAYSTEDEVIEEYEKRTTVKANQFSLPPLDYRLRESSKGSKRGSKDGKDTKRETKKTSQRDPTPYPRSTEHGGKENKSSTYRFSLLPSPIRSGGKGTNTKQSPERPNTIAVTTRRPILADRGRPNTGSPNTAQNTTQPSSQSKPLSMLSRQPSDRSQRSRPQSKAALSRPQSRHSSTIKNGRDCSRTQSSAFPYFDPASFAVTLPSDMDPSKSTTRDKMTGTTASLYCRDLNGDTLNSTNSSLNSNHRKSNVHANAASKRNTAIASAPSAPAQAHIARDSTATYSIGLGLDLVGASLGLGRREREETPGPESDGERGRERMPLGELGDGNGAGLELPRIVEGKGKRPVSTEVDSELKVGASRKGRTTWGSLKAVVGRGYWEGRDMETKAFL